MRRRTWKYGRSCRFLYGSAQGKYRDIYSGHYHLDKETKQTKNSEEKFREKGKKMEIWVKEGKYGPFDCQKCLEKTGKNFQTIWGGG